MCGKCEVGGKLKTVADKIEGSSRRDKIRAKFEQKFGCSFDELVETWCTVESDTERKDFGDPHHVVSVARIPASVSVCRGG